MNTSKNKLLTGLVLLLLIANLATIVMFWLGKPKPPRPALGGGPAEFLIKELNLDSIQQKQFELLRTQHHDSAEKLRAQIKVAKDSFFSLLKQTTISDSAKQFAAKAVSTKTEELDLLTFNHFEKLRAICKPAQQKKFDEIMLELTQLISQQRPRGPEGHRPPPRDHEGHRPPPPEGPRGEGPPPDGPPPPPEGDGPPLRK
jgi:hypothetical protein